MNHPFSVTEVKANKARGTARGELTEHGIVVARYKFNRQAYPQLTIKFGSSQAQSRFDAFCDSLSRAETIEALGGV